MCNRHNKGLIEWKYFPIQVLGLQSILEMKSHIRVSRESYNNTLTFDHERKLTNYKTITKVALNERRSLRTKPNSVKCDTWHKYIIACCVSADVHLWMRSEGGNWRLGLGLWPSRIARDYWDVASLIRLDVLWWNLWDPNKEAQSRSGCSRGAFYVTTRSCDLPSGKQVSIVSSRYATKEASYERRPEK